MPQVCRYYLKGCCAYGDGCRYLHVKPDWSQRGQAGANGSGSSSRAYAPPPAVPRPRADDLEEQLPISRLRLGGQAPDAAPPLPLPLPLPLPVRLPGSTEQQDEQESGAGAAEQHWQEAAGAAGQQWQEEEEQEWYGEEAGGYWVEGPDGEQFWVEADDEAAEHWEEGGWEDGGSEEDWGQQQYGGSDAADGEQHSGLQPPADGSSGRPAAWSLPAAEGDGEGEEQWAGSSRPALRSLCMQWFKTGACAKGAACKLVHGQLCQVRGCADGLVRRLCSHVACMLFWLGWQAAAVCWVMYDIAQPATLLLPLFPLHAPQFCSKHALNPGDQAARGQHTAECRLRHERLAARARRQAGLFANGWLNASLGAPACLLDTTDAPP